MKNEKSQIKIGAVLSYLNMLIGNLIPLFYIPIMLELLGQSEYGLYKLASSATSYLSLVAFGVGSSVSRYLIKARTEEGKEAEERIFGLFHVIFQVIALVTCVIGWAIAFNLDKIYNQSLTANELQRMTLLVLILTANTAIGFSGTAYCAVVTSHERFLFLQAVNVVTTCITPIANLVALYLGFASVGMVTSSLIFNVFVRILYFVYVHNTMKIKPTYRRMPFHLIKEILVYSFWVFLSSIVSQLYNATDIMIIGSIPALSTVGVAIYNIGAVFSNMLSSLATAVSSLFGPRANRMVFSGASNSELTEFMIRIGRYQCYLITLVCSGFVAFGREFILWYVGSEYLEAYWVAIFTMTPACIPLVQSVALSVIQAKNKHQFRSIIYLVIAVINVIGTYALVHSYGIVGAALMTGLASIVGQGILMNWYYYKRIGLDIPRFWRNILKIEWVPVLLCVITLLIGRSVDFTNLSTLLAGILIYTASYFLLNWLFTMNNSEKDLVRSVLHRTKKTICKHR